MIAKHNRSAAETNRLFIECNQGHLECKDCGRRVTEKVFKFMTNEKCGWDHGLAFKYMDIKDTKERIEMERRWSTSTRLTQQNRAAKASHGYWPNRTSH